MPKREKFLKEDIIEQSIEFIKEKGLANLNARDLAKYIGCSTRTNF